MSTRRRSSSQLLLQSAGLQRAQAVQAASGSVNTERGYDEAALRYAGQILDPYEDLARQYLLAGRRFPEPYAAKAAEVSMQAAKQRTQFAGQNHWQAVYPAASVAGHHMTQWGAAADATRSEFEPWDARHQAGYMELGYRGAGLVVSMDEGEKMRRDSGILQSGQMTMDVNPERPYLMLTCPSGSAEVTLLAGMEGGAETRRAFMLGGGFTASFCLDAYNMVRVRILQQEDTDSVVNFAWLANGMQAGDQSLYHPQLITVVDLDVQLPVPSGAYQVKCTSDDNAAFPADRWTWDNPISGVSITDGIVAGTDWNKVGGSMFTPQVANSLIWRKRPI